MRGFVSLSAFGLTLTFDRFLTDSFPRVDIDPPESERSTRGNFVVYGYAYEAPNLFEFTAICSQTEMDIAEAIYREQWRRIEKFRELQLEPGVVLTDTTRRFTERSPRTRATAAAPFDQVGTLPDGVTIAYYPQFLVRFSRAPKPVQKGNWVGLSLVFDEFERKVTP